MAVVWLNSTATSSTSFNTISIWSTWDGDNNQEVPLGRLPQSGDYIYANGYICLIPTGTLNLGTAILSNGSNPYTGRNGGTFFFIAAGTYNITANVEHFGFSVVLGNTSQVSANKRQLTLQGNVISFTTNGTFAIKAGGSGGRTIINGNVNGEYCLESEWGFSTIIINGNVNSAGALSFYGSGGGTNAFDVTINGNCRDNFVVANGQQQSQFSSITISGNYTNTLNANPFNRTVVTLNVKNIINTGVELVVTTLNISGYIYYRGYNNKVGVCYTTLNILNPDTFTWKDVTEPRSNPFIILTDAEMNNRQQYPQENEVKEGTEYVWGEKIGTYTPDYPPESVVLKDYEYGDSDDPKTGTMENEVIVEVDNTNTINVYPYKRRNNG